MKFVVYYRLMRFHKPAGIALLWFPTAWALWCANQGIPSIQLISYFFLGTICMRAAGCVVNDIADRHIDKHVARTKMRPLTAGDVTLMEAIGVFCVLLCIAFYVLIQLPPICFYYAVPALFLTILYPFCKRFFQAPQLVLGLAFSMGMPMAYAASGASIDKPLVILCFLNFLWIVAYDTMYAMADRVDDLQIGVQSTAILFAQYDISMILCLQGMFHGLWLVLVWLLFPSFEYQLLGFYVAWVLAGGVLIYQQTLLRTRHSTACLRAFSTNSLYGLLMWLGLCMAFL